MRPRAGFTLLESLLAAGILLIIVISVTLAVAAGQQNGFEAQQRISATLAAEELMGRLTQVEFKDLRKDWHGYTEDVGEMVDVNGQLLPPTFSTIGRTVTVTNTVKLSPTSGVNVLGRTVIVRCFDANDRTLAELRRFVAHPTPGLTAEELDDLVIELNNE